MDFFLHTWHGGLALMLVSSIIIAKACNVFESATDYLGRNLSDGVKGATLNAIGSSMPELLTTAFFLAFATTSTLGNDFAASVGGDTGSAIFNSIVIPMLVIWMVIVSMVGIKGIKVSKKVILRDGLFLISAEILLLVLLSSSYISHWHGWIFTAFYLLYIAFTIGFMKKKNLHEQEEERAEEEYKNRFIKYQFKSNKGITTRSWLLLIISTLVIAAACAGLVEGCKGVAHGLGINSLFVALVLVAAASSLPDTIISIKDAKKGNYNDALSNVLGSNIFDITVSMGLPLALFLLVTGHKIDFREAGPTLIDLRIMLLIITTVTIAVFYFSKSFRMKHVGILAILYIFFLAYAIGAAAYHAGDSGLLAEAAGYFIESLKGLHTFLQHIADDLTGNW